MYLGKVKSENNIRCYLYSRLKTLVACLCPIRDFFLKKIYRFAALLRLLLYSTRTRAAQKSEAGQLQQLMFTEIMVEIKALNH